MKAQDRLDVTRRLVSHLKHGTTDQAEGIARVAVEVYRDPERFERELEVLFRRSPVVVALSAQLREPGCYRAIEVAGVPVLCVRQQDAGVRVFLNVCRHRGTPLCEEGLGRARRFTCPYHAWSYDLAGALVGLPGAASFGDLDRATRGLTELACEERAGMVFAVVTPGVVFDLDAWLGDYAAVLDSLGLAEMHFYAEREIPGPNWKLAYDGYVDGYHLDKLHRQTLGTRYIGNVIAADAFGPHQRLAFPTRALDERKGESEGRRGGWPDLGVVHTVFPHVSVAGGGGVPTMVSQLFPGPAPDRSRTVQTHLVPNPIETPEERGAMDRTVDFLEKVVRDEDYKMGLGIQAALASQAGGDFLFGRNEPCNQLFHRWVEQLLREAERR